MAYLAREGVDVKVISGDALGRCEPSRSPQASRAERGDDGRELPDDRTRSPTPRAALVFARVTPEQKRALVLA